jgi:hypothetical protein
MADLNPPADDDGLWTPWQPERSDISLGAGFFFSPGTSALPAFASDQSDILLAPLTTENIDEYQSNFCTRCWSDFRMPRGILCELQAHWVCFDCIRRMFEEALYQGFWPADLNVENGTFNCPGPLGDDIDVDCPCLLPRESVRMVMGSTPNGRLMWNEFEHYRITETWPELWNVDEIPLDVELAEFVQEPDLLSSEESEEEAEAEETEEQMPVDESKEPIDPAMPSAETSDEANAVDPIAPSEAVGETSTENPPSARALRQYDHLSDAPAPWIVNPGVPITPHELLAYFPNVSGLTTGLASPN